MFRVSKYPFLALVLFLSIFVGAEGQIDPCNHNMPDITQRGRPRATEAEDAHRDEMRQSQQRKMNEERQSSLKKDTDELFTLASQLKESVERTNQNTLSVEVIRKTQQIEKLAKSVREKMKGNLYCDLQAH